MPSAASRPRIHCEGALGEGAIIELPPVAARHVQVLRLQPGQFVTLFNGEGGEWEAAIERMGRSDVVVRVGTHAAIEREAPREVHLAVGMPANERMDWLVEKATELGVASLQPLAVERSVLKLAGERAGKKRLHWQGVAAAACEQCGRNRVPAVHGILSLREWLAGGGAVGARALLSPDGAAQSLSEALPANGAVTFLSGPEGGLAPAEEAAARDRGFTAVSLGSRILRSETAPLAALARLVLA